MKALHLAAITLVAALSGHVHAAPGQSARPIQTPAPEYPEQAYAQGHQGKVLVKLRIGADGNVDTAEVQESSKSAALDAAALTAVRSWKFSPFTDDAGKATAGIVVLPVEFAKDTTASVMQKPCSDLTADVGFFRATYPGKPLSDMRIYKLTQGIVFLSEPDMQKKLAVSRAFPSAFAAAVARCESNPGDTYGNALAAARRN